jgi:D-3-phosphoglycerate dehydrogenase
MKRVLIATEKPFAPVALQNITGIFEKTGYDVRRLEKYASKADLLNAVKDVDALIIRSDIVDRAVVDAAVNLKVVVRAGSGFDNIDLAACKERGIVAMNTPGQNSNAVAELAIGMMIFMARGNFKGGQGTELKGKTLGLYGCGNIGRRVAKIAHGFGMKVIAFDPCITKIGMDVYDILVAGSVEEIFAKSDYLSLHIPSNPDTRKLINYSKMSLMPKGATLINTARKEVIDEDDLQRMLEERPDFKYVTDIAPDNHAELDGKFGTRYYATPKKQGAETAEANINAGIAAAEQIVAYFERGDQTFRVNW